MHADYDVRIFSVNVRIQKYEVEKINLVEKVTVSPETYLLPKLLLKKYVT